MYPRLVRWQAGASGRLVERTFTEDSAILAVFFRSEQILIGISESQLLVGCNYRDDVSLSTIMRGWKKKARMAICCLDFLGRIVVIFFFLLTTGPALCVGKPELPEGGRSTIGSLARFGRDTYRLHHVQGLKVFWEPHNKLKDINYIILTCVHNWTDSHSAE